MPNFVIELAGWVPAIIFPGASLVQLFTVIKSPHTEGVSIVTWLLFALANVAAYIYLQKYWAPQALAFILAAIFQTLIAVITYRKRRAAIASN